MKIELDAPNVGNLEKKYLNEAINKGFVSTFGPFVPAFEKKVTDYLGVKRSVAVQSGTAAIYMSLYELGIGPGDEVIVPALTFVATVNPILHLGATPVIVDVDCDTWCISSEEIEKNITKRTKAVIPVHLYGTSCDMDKIMKTAKRHNLYVVEDATESLGAEYRGRYTGTFGDFGCLSFNGNKIVTTGGGGMIVGKDKKRIEHIRFLANQARDTNKEYYYPEIGFNYRMTNLEAVIGIAQMEKLGGFLDKKKKFSKIYRKELGELDFIRFQSEPYNSASSHWLISVIIEKDVEIGDVEKKLKAKNVPARRVFMPITEMPPYAKFKKGKYENSYQIYGKGLCLPSSTLNSFDDIRYVCKTLKKLMN